MAASPSSLLVASAVFATSSPSLLLSYATTPVLSTFSSLLSSSSSPSRSASSLAWQRDNLGSILLQTSQPFCKLRAYLVSAIPLVATYLVLLASIDRCLSSSVHARLRSFSQMKVAYRATFVAVVIGFGSCSHILVSYDLRPRLRHDARCICDVRWSVCGVLAGSDSTCADVGIRHSDRLEYSTSETKTVVPSTVSNDRLTTIANEWSRRKRSS